jgi:hypothetical protein
MSSTVEVQIFLSAIVVMLFEFNGFWKERDKPEMNIFTETAKEKTDIDSIGLFN